MTDRNSLVEDMARAMGPETRAAAAIIDVMMNGDTSWRSRLGDSDFLESADWATATVYARAALSVLKDRLPADDRELVERLQLQAQRASDIARQMAQAKSLRQEGRNPPRDDLYMWPTAEQTIEGKAADRIIAYSASMDEPVAERRPDYHAGTQGAITDQIDAEIEGRSSHDQL